MLADWRRLPQASIRNAAKWRILPILILVSHLLLVAYFMPLQDRWYISPDDGDALRYGRAVANHGLPILREQDILPAGINAAEAFQPAGTFRVGDDAFATVRPPLWFFVIGPATPFGATGIFVATQVVSVLALIGLYFVLEKIGGPWIGAIGLLLAALHPSFLYWSWFPRSNILGVGMLSAALLCFQQRRGWAQVVGGALLPLLPLARFEFAPIAIGIGVWGGIRFLASGDRGWRKPMLLGSGVVLGLLLLSGLSWLLYHSLNLLDVIQGRAGNAPAEMGPAGPVQFGWAILSFNVVAYDFLLAGPLTWLVGATLIRRRQGLAWPTAAGAMLVTTYIFMGTYAEQPIFMLQSPTRYVLPLVLAAAVVLSCALTRAPTSVVAVVMVSALMSTTAGVAFLGESGAADDTRIYTTHELEFVRAAGHLPKASVCYGQYLANALPDRICFRPEVWSNLTERHNRVLQVTHALLEHGIPVFGDLEQSSYLAGWIGGDPRFNVTTIGLFWHASLAAQK